MSIPVHPVRAVVALGIVFAFGNAALANDDKPAVPGGDLSFGNRTDNPDGSSAMTVGRRLPLGWDTKVGTDLSLAAPESVATSDSLLRGPASDRSSGALWGNLLLPGLQPLGFDKTSLDARLDAGSDQGKVGATLSRSLPIGQELSVTFQNSYSMTQSLNSTPSGVPPPSAFTASPTPSSPTPAGQSAPAWAADETLRLNIVPSGTTLSANAGSSTGDTQWHNRLSMEQTLYGPLKLTTSIENVGTAATNKSILAGFKRTW